MGILSDFEHRLENLFEGVFSKTFRSGVHPLEIGRRLIREMEEKRTISINETLAPNLFEVTLSTPDYERFASFSGTVSAELSKLLMEQAQRRSYSLLTAPRILFAEDASLREGEFRVHGQVASEATPQAVESAPAPQTPTPSPPAPASEMEAMFMPAQPVRGAAPPLMAYLVVTEGEGSGTVYELSKEQVTMGRATGNDIVLGDPQVSRRHAMITRRPDSFLVADLHSTNGTLINGHKVEEGLLDEGDILTLGSTNFRFTLHPG